MTKFFFHLGLKIPLPDPFSPAPPPALPSPVPHPLPAAHPHPSASLPPFPTRAHTRRKATAHLMLWPRPWSPLRAHTPKGNPTPTRCDHTAVGSPRRTPLHPRGNPASHRLLKGFSKVTRPNIAAFEEPFSSPSQSYDRRSFSVLWQHLRPHPANIRQSEKSGATESPGNYGKPGDSGNSGKSENP